MIEPLYGLKIDFDPEVDDDGNAITTVENIEVLQKNGNILLQFKADSCSTFRWRADIGCPVIGDWSISVSRAAMIRINPPIEDDGSL